MTTDLWMLVAAVGLTWALIMVAATPSVAKNPTWAVGNREAPLAVPAWAERAKRTSANMQENLPLFTALVLVAHVSGQADSLSALGAQIFVGARVVHAGIYIAGVPMIRTLVWLVSVVGMGMIAASLL